MQLTRMTDMSLFDATKPLLVVSRLVAINPKSNWYKVYTVFVMVSMLSMICYAWLAYIRLDFQHRHLNVFVYALDEAFRVTSLLVIWGLSLFDKKRFMVPLEDFVSVDKNLKSLNGFLDNSGTYRYQVVLVIYVGLILLLLGPVKFSLDVIPKYESQLYESHVMNWCYILIVIIVCVVADCLFLSTLSIIRKRFNTINGIIDRIRKRGSYLRINFLEVSRTTVIEDLRILRKQYHKLWGIANRVNAAYGPHLLVGATTSFVLTTCELWMSYVIFMNPNNAIHHSIFERIIWVIFWVMRMLFLVNTSEFTVAEAKATAAVLQELEMEGDFDPAMYGEIRNFLTQLQFEIPKFTASGFFEIDSTLICGIFGAVCTYLVILIQIATTVSAETGRNNDSCMHSDHQ